MIADRCPLSGTPDEADNLEAAERIAMQQVLPVSLGVRRHMAVGQPRIVG